MRQSLLQDILIYGLPEHLIHFGVVSDFFLLWYIVLVGVLKDFGLISSKYRERKKSLSNKLLWVLDAFFVDLTAPIL
jgi:hypothetical protein